MERIRGPGGAAWAVGAGAFTPWFYGAPVAEPGWRVHFIPAQCRVPAGPLPFVASLPPDWEGWLRDAGLVEGTPFLVSPGVEYDVELNAFFSSADMATAAWNTQAGYARDVAAFLNFLWRARGATSWRDATEADHIAYLIWRRRDEHGPHIDDATWDREVAAVNRFYKWQVAAGNVVANPVPQRKARLPPVHAARGPRHEDPGEAPATYSHGAGRDRIEWLPQQSYRRWRDVGVRGYTSAGFPDPRFRGRWAARNAAFCDLMVRTGLRLAEQSALSVFEVPTDRGAGYRRFWLPEILAKGASARWIYVPGSVRAELSSYVAIDRAEVVSRARADGRYQQLPRPLVLENPDRPVLTQRHPGGLVRRVPLAQLGPTQRPRVLIDGDSGLEPAAFWLSEQGLALAKSTWKDMFTEATRRCHAHGLALAANPHLLRHSFAVITLEQLQRGHLSELAKLTPGQRTHYARTFGDPLDWVRARLGHRSMTTTLIYLHALSELAMETRLALVPEDWEDPREDPALETGEDGPPAGPVVGDRLPEPEVPTTTGRRDGGGS